MKRISHKKGILHIETALGIINIHVGLTDHEGRRVECVEIIPDRFTGGSHRSFCVRVGDRVIESKDSTDAVKLEHEALKLSAERAGE